MFHTNQWELARMESGNVMCNSCMVNFTLYLGFFSSISGVYQIIAFIHLPAMLESFPLVKLLMICYLLHEKPTSSKDQEETRFRFCQCRFTKYIGLEVNCIAVVLM